MSAITHLFTCLTCMRNPMNHVAITFILALSSAGLFADDWRGFRGPTGMGVTTEKNLPLEWGGPDNKNIQWKTALPPTLLEGDADHNQSSPVVAQGMVIVTTAHWPSGADRKAKAAEHHVAAYDAKTGKQRWDSTVPAGPWILSDLRGGYAAPTPAVSDGRIVALFGSSILHALDLEGRLLWSKIIADHDKFDVALPISPVVYKDTVILLLDRKAPASTLLALDVASGETRWEVARPDTEFGHMTPVLAMVNDQPQLIVCATHAVQGVNPENGELLWSCTWDRSIWPVSSPVVAQGLVYAIGGRGGHPGMVVDPTGHGDVSASHLKYRIGPASEGLSSPVAFGEFIYRFNSPGVIRCIRIGDGEEIYKERLPNANPSVSPFVTPEGRIYFASAGKTVVVEAGPTLNIVAESDLGEPSHAAAAVADGKIFLKGHKFLYAIGF